MAEKTKESVSTNDLVEIRLPRRGKEDSIFVGVNFKNYRIKLGEKVKVPKAVAEVLRRSEIAEEAANAYALEKEDAYFEKAANPTQMH